MTETIILEYDVKTGKVEQKTGKMKEGIDETKDSVNGLGDAFGILGGKVDELSGGLTSGLRSGISAIGAATKGMKLFRAAVISTGVGALVVAIGSLVAYFQSTEEGAKKLKIATEFLSVIFSKLTGVLAELGGFIVSAFTEPQQALDKLKEKLQPVFDFLQDINTIVIGQVIKNFKQMGAVLTFVRMKFNELMGDEEEALKLQQELAQTQQEIADLNDAQAESWDGIKEAVGDTVDAVVDGFNTIVEETKDALDIAQRYADAQFRTRNLIQKLTVDNAMLNAEIETQQKVIDDTTRSFEERNTALDEQNIASEKLAQNISVQAQAEEDLLRQQISITTSLEEREELETQLSEKIAERIDAEKTVGIVKLDNAQKSREIDLEEVERQKTILQTIQDLELENELDEQEKYLKQSELAEERHLQELELLRTNEDEKQAVRDAYAEARAIKQAEFDAKEDEANQAQKDKEIADAKAVQDSKIQMAMAATQAIISVVNALATDDEKQAKKRFQISKALNLSLATANTALAISDALAKDATFPGSRFIAAAAAGAMGVAQIATIQQTQFNATGPDPTTTPPSGIAGSLGAGGAGVQAPFTNFNNAETGPNQNAIPAYVIGQSVTNQQQADQLVQDQARL